MMVPTVGGFNVNYTVTPAVITIPDKYADDVGTVDITITPNVVDSD